MRGVSGVLNWSFLFIVPLFFTLSWTPVLAQTSADNAAAKANQAQQSQDEEFIQNIGNQAIKVMADKSLAPGQRSQKYHDILQNSFDIRTIGRFVLGRSWNTATPQQQQEFTKLFEKIVLKTYGDRLNLYSGESFKVSGEHKESDKDTIVNSDVTHTDGSPPTKIDWRVRQAGGKQSIVDVVVEGVSQSVTQRQEYSSILQRNNGNIDALLDMMRQRTQEGTQEGSSDNTGTQN